MESELKDFIPSQPPTPSKDERPLLKSDSGSALVPQESIEELEKKFAAYVRHDVYGTLGMGELPLTEKFLLGIALVTIVPVRLVLGIAILVLYYLICRVCTLFSVPNREEEQEDYAHMVGWRRAVIVQCGRFFSRAMLFTFGFYWIDERNPVSDAVSRNCDSDENECKEQPKRPGAIISNHISYVDILYHMSSSFPSFVAKRSVARLPLVGLISKCLGCVYVQRESRSSKFKGVSGVVIERIQAAHQNKNAPMMMLFPEGTTTNGNFLLPFKTGAFLSKAPVLPVILRYPYQRFSPAWDTISGKEQEDPKLYANNMRKLMANEGNLILSDIGLAEKRVYHAALHGNSPPSVLHHRKDE